MDYLINNEEKAPGLRGTGFYSSKKWRETRDLIKIRDRMTCRKCGQVITGRYIVDHIKEVNILNKNNWDIAYNPDNLQLLCQKCHNGKTFGKLTDETRTLW